MYYSNVTRFLLGPPPPPPPAPSPPLRHKDALDPNFLQRLHAVLNLTDATGIHVMLDNHGDMTASAGCGNGVPMWLSKLAAPELIGKPLTTGSPFNLVPSLDIKKLGGYSHCGSNETKWQAFAGDPNYNLLNECCAAINSGNPAPTGYAFPPLTLTCVCVRVLMCVRAYMRLEMQPRDHHRLGTLPIFPVSHAEVCACVRPPSLSLSLSFSLFLSLSLSLARFRSRSPSRFLSLCTSRYSTLSSLYQVHNHCPKEHELLYKPWARPQSLCSVLDAGS